MNTTSRGPRRWSQFTLRGLLCFTFLVAVCAAWVGYQRRLSHREATIAEQLRAQGWYISFVGPYLQRAEYGIDAKEDLVPAWWRRTLSDLCGPRIRLARHNGSPPAFDMPGFKMRYLDGSDFGKSKPCDLSLLAGLGMLDEVSVQFASIPDPAPLAKLPKLKKLSLAYTGISDLAPLAELRLLETLNLSHNRASDLTPLAKLNRVTRLLLHNSPLIRDITPLAGLRNLETLNLAETRVVDIGPLAGLKRLTSLSVDRTPVSDLSAITAQKNLRSLSIRGSQVDEHEGRRVRSSLPECKIYANFVLPQPESAGKP
jgi:hypothetical protein